MFPSGNNGGNNRESFQVAELEAVRGLLFDVSPKFPVGVVRDPSGGNHLEDFPSGDNR